MFSRSDHDRRHCKEVGGWKQLKTMTFYGRLAAVDNDYLPLDIAVYSDTNNYEKIW